MSEFDPYLAWLDIPSDQRPVNHYRLLGLAKGESNSAAISAAAQRVRDHLQQFRTGQQAAIADKLLTEIEVAQTCLLDPAQKAHYDAQHVSEKARFETVIKPPPPVPSPATSATTSKTSEQEQQINGAPPPPNQSVAPSHETPLQPPAATTSIPVAPPAVPGNIAPPAPPVPGRSAADATTVPSPPLPPSQAAAAPFVPAPPPAQAPPPPKITPVAKPVAAPTPATNLPTSSTELPSTPTWAPEGRTGKVGKSVADTTEGAQPRPAQKTRKAQTMRRRVRQQSEYMVASIIMGVLAIAAGLIFLIVLALWG